MAAPASSSDFTSPHGPVLGVDHWLGVLPLPRCHLCVPAVMDITDITKGTCDSDEDKQHFIPVHL